MSTALVVRTQRHKKIGDSSSPMVYTLKRKPQDAKIFDLARIAQDIEALGAMSSEDVEHVGKAIVRQMRQTLTDGNSVRLDGFGIFHTTFKCRATELAKDCTVEKRARQHPLQGSQHPALSERQQRHHQRRSKQPRLRACNCRQG